jgi:hypothetical protein
MGDVTMVDTSVFGALNRQNSGPVIAKDLEDLSSRGEELVVCASAYQEIQNTKDPSLKAAQLQQIQDFKMVVQSPTTLAERTDHHVVDANLNPKARGVELKDLPIVADVRIYMKTAGSKKVRLFTVERMASNSNSIKTNYKIEFSDKSRKLSNLGPRAIFRRPPPTSTPPGGGGPGAPGGPSPGMPRVGLGWSGKIGSGIKAGGMALGAIGLQFLLGWLAQKIYQKYAQQEIDRQFEALRPKIERDIRSKIEDALYLAATDKEAFAIIRLSVWTATDITAGQGTSMPTLDYLGLFISPIDMAGEESSKTDSSIPSMMMETSFFRVSSKLTFTPDEIKAYKNYIAQLKWFDDQLSIVPSPEDQARLTRDRAKLFADMKAALSN